MTDDMHREAFERWWYGSKYMQVVISNESAKQAALDGYEAAIRHLTEQNEQRDSHE